MAAIRKSELSGIFTQKQQTEIQALESQINEELRKEYAGDRVVIQLQSVPHPKVKQEIERSFREAGWTIQFHSEQMGGNWVELK